MKIMPPEIPWSPPHAHSKQEHEEEKKRKLKMQYIIVAKVNVLTVIMFLSVAVLF